MLPNAPMTIKVPGKLMIAGEFAVLQPHHELVVMAVDRFVYATIEDHDANRITLNDFGLYDIGWTYADNRLTFSTDDQRTRFVGAAMATALTYLKEKNIHPTPFRLAIKSELDDVSGIKYGLGSSAAVVTSVISAILNKYNDEKAAALLTFKLAAISHVRTQGNGSGADVAASSYGGFLQYASFQAEWLKEQYENTPTITELLEKDWPYLSIKPVKIPSNVYVCIGWTGKPASTSRLVDDILKLKTANQSQFKQFLDDSETAVSNFLQGMTEGDLPLLLQGIKQNRKALATVGENAGVEIETPLLRTLCDIAENMGGAGKPSGAGGGDCGIAFMPSKKQAEEIVHAWEAAGIKPLTIQPFPTGAHIVS
ncbi:phosphomevalonate kinase [Virgibacillus halodenitrificans]|uniref:phosphomevalonate kinase n=2 Tax=Virgibacillus halodenitrificans TaxID=1482 RepID=A0ABR7VR69_VIRHA|nr:phosphomevalonate kinase [Virgibacillus halodenitrificans]